MTNPKRGMIAIVKDANKKGYNKISDGIYIVDKVKADVVDLAMHWGDTCAMTPEQQLDFSAPFIKTNVPRHLCEFTDSANISGWKPTYAELFSR